MSPQLLRLTTLLIVNYRWVQNDKAHIHTFIENRRQGKLQFKLKSVCILPYLNDETANLETSSKTERILRNCIGRSQTSGFEKYIYNFKFFSSLTYYVEDFHSIHYSS